MSDFRQRNLATAIARAEQAEAMADKGGDALTTAEGYAKRAASWRRHAEWIEAKIAKDPA